MTVTVDRAGRVVIPKDARDRLQLGPDAELDLAVEGDSIRLTPVRRAGRTFHLVDGFPRIDTVAGITTTDADVRAWRDADQR
ncbi:MAG: AbrB/MazE/SpoVT family DNA-binding domain-containing protein [Micrococcales bacterium]|nr:AbrB/MazE/SpoVT family DNA-binding domain-containing protein [Micrococcales bacterium]